MKTKLAALLFPLAILLTLSSCQSAPNGQLSFGIMPDLNCIPFVVAKQQGYFDANVTYEIYKSAMDRDSALMSGNIDGAASDILAVCLAQEGEFKVYMTSKTNGWYGILAGANSGITTAKDLEGRQIGISLNTVIEYVVDTILIEGGADISKVEKISLPKLPSRLELLQAGQIDSIALPEPFLSAAVAEGAILVNTSVDVSLEPGIMLFTQNAVETKKAELKSFYAAYDKAVKYINETPKEKFMPGVIAELGLPQSAINVELPIYQTAALPGEEEVARAMNWLVSRDMLKNTYEYNQLIWEIK